MDLFRSVIFALLSLVLLVDASLIRRRRFGLNYSTGYGKRDSHFPGFGKRPYVYKTVQDYGKDKSRISANEELLPYWFTNSDPLPDWNEQEYYYPTYEPRSQQNVNSALDYVDPADGYIRSNPKSLQYANNNHMRFSVEGRNDHSIDSPSAYRKVDGVFAGKISGGHDRQNLEDDQTTRIAQLLKKLLPERDQENIYPTWQ